MAYDLVVELLLQVDGDEVGAWVGRAGFCLPLHSSLLLAAGGLRLRLRHLHPLDCRRHEHLAMSRRN